MSTLILRWFSQFSIESQRSRVDKNISFKLQCQGWCGRAVKGKERKSRYLKPEPAQSKAQESGCCHRNKAWRQQSTEQSDRTRAGDNAGDCGEAKGFSVAYTSAQPRGTEPPLPRLHPLCSEWQRFDHGLLKETVFLPRCASQADMLASVSSDQIPSLTVRRKRSYLRLKHFAVWQGCCCLPLASVLERLCSGPAWAT